MTKSMEIEMKYLFFWLVLLSLCNEVLAAGGSGRQLAIVEIQLTTGEFIGGYYIVQNGGSFPAPPNGFWVIDEQWHQYLYVLGERDQHHFQRVTGETGKRYRVYFARAKESHDRYPKNLRINERTRKSGLVGEVSYRYDLLDTVKVYKALETHTYGAKGYGYRFDLSMPIEVKTL